MGSKVGCWQRTEKRGLTLGEADDENLTVCWILYAYSRASLIAQLVKNLPTMWETPILGSGRSAGEGIGYPLQYSWASLMTQPVKNLPAMWETWVRSLGWEDPLEKGKVPTSVFLPRECHRLCIGYGVTKSQTQLSDFHTHMHTLGYHSNHKILSPMSTGLLLWPFFFYSFYLFVLALPVTVRWLSS